MYGTRSKQIVLQIDGKIVVLKIEKVKKKKSTSDFAINENQNICNNLVENQFFLYELRFSVN